MNMNRIFLYDHWRVNVNTYISTWIAGVGSFVLADKFRVICPLNGVFLGLEFYLFGFLRYLDDRGCKETTCNFTINSQVKLQRNELSFIFAPILLGYSDPRKRPPNSIRSPWKPDRNQFENKKI